MAEFHRHVANAHRFVVWCVFLSSFFFLSETSRAKRGSTLAILFLLRQILYFNDAD